MSPVPRLVRLAILDSYGVEWSLATFARDVLQNFFDVALSFRDVTIERDDAASTLEIRGPAEFDLELLAYVGATTKLDGKTAGGFGEGFKICALVGVRDHGLAIHAGSGETELEVVFEPVPLGRELCYRVRDAPGRKGSFVRLEGCTQAVFAAFETAKNQFYHEDNPHIGPLVAADHAGTVAVHLAAPGEKHGEIYYRRQFRGEIAYRAERDIPMQRLTLACHYAVDALDGDRDRRVLEAYAVACAVGERLPPEGLRRAIGLLEADWRDGHDVLFGLLRAATDRNLRFEWPDKWVARSGNDHGLTRLAERNGFKVARPEFVAIGMKRASDVIRRGKAETRSPNSAERERIDTAIALYETLTGENAPAREWEVFDGRDTQPPHVGHGNRKLFVSSRKLAAGGFAQGTAALLHEISHELGDEDSPAFLNRLARLVGAAIRDPSAVAAARARFERDLPPGQSLADSPEVEPYKPAVEEHRGKGRLPSCFMKVYVPPGFPATTALVERLHEGAAAAGFACYPCVLDIWTAADAQRLGVRGIPSVVCGSIDPIELDAEHAPRRPGLRLRTYGPDRRILPSVEMVAEAIRAHAEKMRAWTLPIEPLEKKLETRDFMARAQCQGWIKATAKGEGSAQLAIGLSHACALHIDAVKKGIEQTYEELFATIRDDVLRMKHAADAHLAAESALDPGDGFEEEGLRWAHAAFLAGIAASGAERAARDFAVVREATKELMAADLSSEIREGVLAWCVGRTGPREHYTIDASLRPLDEAAFRAAFATALAEARRLQPMLDREERGLRHQELEQRLDSAMLTPEGREEAREKKRAQDADRARWSRQYRMRNALTHTIKETWERTLAEAGSEAAAGEACVALLRRLESKLAAESRRVKAGDA